MSMLLRRILCLAVCLCVLSTAVPIVGSCTGEAQNISGPARIAEQSGFYESDRLFDGILVVPSDFSNHSWITLEYKDGIGSLYLIFHYEYGIYTVTNNDTGETAELGQNGFLHDFVDLEAIFGTAPSSVTLSFDNGPLRLNEICMFTTGQVPDYVQRWETPEEGKTDLLLFSAHGDDEQLFFAGMLPYYAGELGYQVQVVYLTNHRTDLSERCHEMLDGLYAVGVTTYPVFGPFNDHYSQSLETAYHHMNELGVTEEDLVGFVVEQLRRFKPLVAVTHDVNGEYGHGQHMLFADLLMKAVEISMDPLEYPELAQQYGVWDVPKTYLHLYPENEIVLDLDKPLNHFDGMTAYQVTRYLGFPCHKTQFYSYLWYFSQGENAADITQYSPCYYGLYRSRVGADTRKNDFFENLTTYTQLAQEEARQKWLASPRSMLGLLPKITAIYR